MHTSIKNTTRSRIMLGFGRLLVCATLIGGATTIFAQATTEPAAPAAGGGHGHGGQKTWIDKFKLGGWVMYPCVGFSVLTVWLSVDLWMRTGRKRLSPDAHVNGTKDLFRMGDYVGAYQFAKGNPSAFSDTVRVSLSYLGDGQEATEGAMFSELNKFNASITTRINYLSVIGVCTPMVGLLGTVGGMMGAFETMGTSGISDPGALSEKIGEVLIATATGLAIAIPAFLMFYVLRNRLQGGMHYVQDMVIALFRKMPYDDLKDCHVGEEEFFAARPNWVDDAQPATAVAA
jgi:biopolymer transport protein ExbB